MMLFSKAISPKNMHFVFLFSICASLAGSQFQQTDSTVDLSAENFVLHMNLYQNEVLIDVRTQKEYNRERIPNALSASNRKILLALTDTLDLEQPLFIYCEEESRSITACSFLQERGFKYVYMLKDGIIGWKERDFTIDKKKITRRKRNKYPGKLK